jgi:hypothetical protein
MLHCVLSLLLLLTRFISPACTPAQSGVFSSWQSITASCVRFENSIFSEFYHYDSWTRVYGGAICYNSSTGTFELLSCTFFHCGAYITGYRSYGGCGYLKAAIIEIDRCCARRCYCEVGQAFCFVGCATPHLTFSTFVNCSESSDGDADYGALSYDQESS